MTQNILISEARKLFPEKNGHLIHINTIRRWIGKGVKRNGRRIRLRAEYIGNRLTTRPEWIEKFIAECSGLRTEPFTNKPSFSSEAAVERFLIAEGVYGQAKKQMSRGRV